MNLANWTYDATNLARSLSTTSMRQMVFPSIRE